MTNRTYEKQEPIQLSAIEHYSYCPRQCALIHLESVWEENIYTMRGRDVHERVHEESSHIEMGIHVERAMPVWSKRLNIVGKADVVEFHGDTPYPVEYKSGRRRKGVHESIQLCAQAICLEEMLGVRIERGALYWHGSRSRKEIIFTDALRNQVEQVVAEVHEMIADKRLPAAANDERCEDCSIKDVCLPNLIDGKKRAVKIIENLFTVSPDP